MDHGDEISLFKVPERLSHTFAFAPDGGTTLSNEFIMLIFMFVDDLSHGSRKIKHILESGEEAD